MNQYSYFMPNMAPPFVNPMMVREMPTNIGFVRTPGLFGRIFNGIKSVNWSGILNGANKTLNVVNQTIPLIRQAKPMFGNMKSMLKLAKAFKNETNVSNIERRKVTDLPQKKEVISDEYPNFFV